MRGEFRGKMIKSSKWIFWVSGNMKAIRFFAGLTDKAMGRTFMDPILT
jgi:hypothetical protein